MVSEQGALPSDSQRSVFANAATLPDPPPAPAPCIRQQGPEAQHNSPVHVCQDVAQGMRGVA